MTTERDDITETLRRRILRGLHAGTVAPGDRLPRARELERDFDVDHRIILAAYRALAGEGLVEMRQRGGIYVAPRKGAAAVPTPAESWMIDLLAQGVSREVPIAEFAEWFRRATDTRRLRAAVVQGTTDQIAGLCRELADDYGLETTGVPAAAITAARTAADLPAVVRHADLLLTTEGYADLVRDLAGRLGKPHLCLTVRPDLVGGEWRLLLRKPVYVIVGDARFLAVLQQFFADTPGAGNLRALVVGRDDLSVIPADAPVYVTRAAREALGDTPLRGRVLPAARVLSGESARALIAFIVRANLDVVTARPAP